MRVLARVAMLAVLAAPAVSQPVQVAADQPGQPAAAATPDAALTARFAAFITSVLAGQLPAAGVTDTMKTAFTPSAIDQVKTTFAPLGAFQTLQFTREDSVQGYQRFHYIATFEKGTQPVIFVIDPNHNIAGFFLDQGQ
jgi:Protein of unknown function (DUF3887)